MTKRAKKARDESETPVSQAFALFTSSQRVAPPTPRGESDEAEAAATAAFLLGEGALAVSAEEDLNVELLLGHVTVGGLYKLNPVRPIA
jgi:hypothetical protein